MIRFLIELSKLLKLSKVINLVNNGEFIAARFRIKLTIVSNNLGMVRHIFCLFENINNFNKKGP